MSDSVQDAIAALRQEISELRADLRARDSLLAAKDGQIVALMEVVARVAEGGKGPSLFPELLVGDLAIKYFEAISDETWAKNRRAILKPSLAHFGKTPVHSLRPPMWTHYRDHIRKKQITQMGTPPAVGTRNLELVCFKVMLNWGVDQELLESNPLARVKKERDRPGRETVIGDDDLSKLLSSAGELLRTFILVAIDSGMRKTEVRLLRWAQIGDGGRVRVSWTVAKTKRSRSVRLSDRSLAAIKELPRVARSPYVFANPSTNEPWSDSHMWQLFRGACADAGIAAAEGDGVVHFHDTRRSAISRAIQNGNPIPVVMRAAGHVTLRMAGRYMQIDETDLDIMKAKNDQAIAAGPRRNPHRAHLEPDGTSTGLEKNNR